MCVGRLLVVLGAILELRLRSGGQGHGVISAMEERAQRRD